MAWEIGWQISRFGACLPAFILLMRHWPELLDELSQTLEMINCGPLSPGLRSAWRQVMKRIGE